MILTAVIVSLISATVGVATLIDAIFDLRDLRRLNVGNGRYKYAKAQIRREVIRLASLFLLLTFTLFALIHIRNLSKIGLWMTEMFIAVQVLICANSVLDLLLNKRVRAWFRLRNKRSTDPSP